MYLVLLCSFFFFPSVASASISSEAITFDTNLDLINLTKDQETKVRLAEEKIKKIISSEEFKKRVLGHMYQGQKTFADNAGLTNLEIYNKILEGAETLLPVKNNRMDMGITAYYKDDSTIGYTTKYITYIQVNTKFFNTLSVNEVAGNMMHEWLHKLGFEHSTYRHPGRNYSVPYAIGSIITVLAESH